MKRIFLLLLVSTFIGCSIEPQTDVPDLPRGSTSALKVTEDCVIKDEWLYKQYDHEIDYANPDIPTDFFLLVYSNSPRFCDYKENKGELNEVPFQCMSQNSFGWVIHGLWGESNSAYINGNTEGHPRFCQGDLDPLSLEAIKPYLCMSPGTSLLQGEWEKHGACDFNTAQEYFDKTKELHGRFKVPPASLKAKNAVHWMKENNPILKDKWLHLTNNEFGICFDTGFTVISCPKQ